MTCVKTRHKIELAQSPEEQVPDGRLDAAVHETSGWRDARGACRGRCQRHAAAAGTPRRRL